MKVLLNPAEPELGSVVVAAVASTGGPSTASMVSKTFDTSSSNHNERSFNAKQPRRVSLNLPALLMQQHEQSQQADATLTAPIRDVLYQEVTARCAAYATQEDAFFVCDVGEVVRQFRRWKSNLPRIEPFFAIKCNPDPMIMGTLAQLGTGFDCASKTEIAAVLELGVEPERIIYANPCKPVSHIRVAQNEGVKMMTFDNAEELHKIKQCYPDAQLVLRILTDDSRSVCQFGVKFGASLNVTKGLLELAKSLDLNIIGVSFHVGSGCFDALAYRDAVQSARVVFDQASEVGYDLRLLDVGGGFPGNHDNKIAFEEIAQVLGPAVDELFPPHVRVIAEPGRFFVASAYTLAVSITARRTVKIPAADGSNHAETSYMFYINDGVYGSFNCLMFDHAVVHPQVLMRASEFTYGQPMDGELKHRCSIWGPTCDSMDCITRNGMLPELDVGDWLYFNHMGAYTCAAASTFNGFRKSTIVFTNTELGSY